MPPNGTFLSENMSRSADQEIPPLNEIMSDTIVPPNPDTDVSYPDLAEISSQNHSPSSTVHSGSPIQTFEIITCPILATHSANRIHLHMFNVVTSNLKYRLLFNNNFSSLKLFTLPWAEIFFSTACLNIVSLHSAIR
jgi:hypothetical protein